MADIRYLITPTPPEVEKRLRRAYRTAEKRVRENDTRGAFWAISEFYDWMLRNQPPGRRYHKGWPLHQMGLFRLESEQPENARRFFLLALVEDILSLGEESPGQLTETQRAAALTLVYGFGVAGGQIVDLAVRLRRRQQAGQLFRHPEGALDEEPLEPALQTPEAREAVRSIPPAEVPREPEWRRLGEFGVPWEDRVFVGGSYHHHFATLRLIRDQVRRHGLDGVLVAEFRSPLGVSVRNKSLTLLKGCRRAVFELSQAGGHLVEFDRLLDYEIERVLVVHHKSEDSVQISAMTRSLFSRVGVKLAEYTDAADLREIVSDWLTTEPSTQA